MDGADDADHSEDNLGSAGSVGETRSPDSKADASSDSEGEDDEGGTSASDLGLSSPGLSLSSLVETQRKFKEEESSTLQSITQLQTTLNMLHHPYK